MPGIDHRIQERFNKFCVRYGLLADGDRILVALSEVRSKDLRDIKAD